MNLDWHADRSDLPALRLIDRAPPSEEIDFEALRRYRLARVRARMAERGVAACVLLDPVNIRYCDFSRTFHAGPDAPSAAQKELYRHAVEQVRHNMDVIRPGMTFREYAGKAWAIPERYVANRYFVSAHGCGMTGEYPYLYHGMDFDAAGYDGVIEPGMTLCVESYIGEEGGTEGVKLEEHCLVTEGGLEPLSRFPLEERLL